MIIFSTGLRNKMLGVDSLASIMADGVIKIYTGSAPASSDDAVTGQELVTITKGSATVKVAKKVTITATISNSADYAVTLNGVTLTYTSSASATGDEISAGLKALIDDAQGNGISGVINYDKLYGRFIVTDVGSSSGQITIEAATAGVDFDVSVGSNLALVTNTESAYGLHFDADSIASGVMTKKANEVWSGVCGASGTAGYFRFVLDDDDGLSSTTEPRIQGTVGTANTDMVVTSTNFAAGATQTVDVGTATMPASRS